MTTEQTIAVVERMRELLADPDRVVLDPMHYFEVENGKVREVQWEEAKRKRETCRVCFCGAASLATFELVERPPEPEDRWSTEWEAWHDADPDYAIRGMVRNKIDELGIPLDPSVVEAYGYDNEVATLTSALKQGRAVEVVDAVLADLRAGLPA